MNKQTSDNTPAISKETLALIRQSAEGGNAQAQYHLGMMYANADSVELDYQQASQWLEKAAKAGLAEAQQALGWLYANGYGVQQDGKQSAHWYMQAAEQGDAKSQYLVASMYRVGSNDLPIDHAQMLRWYQAAAEQQFPPALHMMGRMLANGKYVAKDLTGAFQWLSLAVLSGSEAATETLEEVSKEMPPEQLSEAKQIFRQALEAQGIDVGEVFGKDQEQADNIGHTF